MAVKNSCDTAQRDQPGPTAHRALVPLRADIEAQRSRGFTGGRRWGVQGVPPKWRPPYYLDRWAKSGLSNRSMVPVRHPTDAILGSAGSIIALRAQARRAAVVGGRGDAPTA